MNAPADFQFVPAVREHVSLLIALAGPSGSGKTFSALRLARGFAPEGKIAFIDTEARRGLHYADHFNFMHSDMRPPFSPERFVAGIRAAEASGAEVIVIDSFSDEYDGEGSISDWADELERQGTKSPGNWRLPKHAHKKLMGLLRQCRASIIFCLRADEKIEIVREGGKTLVRPMGWKPICEKRFMYEMTASFTLTADRPGIPHFDLPHKLQEQHRGMFTDKDTISEQSGRQLAEWAKGGKASAGTGMASQEKAASSSASPPATTPPKDDGAATLSLTDWDDRLSDAAQGGMKMLQEEWATVPAEFRKQLKSALDRRHKPAAEKADNEIAR